MEAQHNLSQVLRVVETGQEVGITRRKQLVAKIRPLHGPVDFPNFTNRARVVWGDLWSGTSSAALLDETRGDH